VRERLESMKNTSKKNIVSIIGMISIFVFFKARRDLKVILYSPPARLEENTQSKTPDHRNHL
jgi:hypothetical protein